MSKCIPGKSPIEKVSLQIIWPQMASLFRVSKLKQLTTHTFLWHTDVQISLYFNDSKKKYIILYTVCLFCPYRSMLDQYVIQSVKLCIHNCLVK